MARQDEFSSTERLLDLIRGKEERVLKPPETMPPRLPPSGLKHSFSKALTLKRKITVGVDINDHELRLVKVSQGLEKSQTLLDYTSAPFQSDMDIDSPQFQRFLKSVLTDFCGPAKNIDIWTTISTANVETRFLRIPKVPKKQMFNAVFWTFKKESSFNEQQMVFDFEVLGEIVEEGVRKIEVLSYIAPKHEINQLRQTFAKSGYPLTGICVAPFAIQTLLRTQVLETDVEDVCTLFIGSNFSRIAIYSKGNLILARDIKAGIRSMIDAIRVALSKDSSEPAMPMDDAEDTAMAEPFDDTHEGEPDPAVKLLYDFTHNALPAAGEDEAVRYKSDDIYEIILPALDRVIRQVERTIKHFSVKYENDGVDKIFISGQMSANRHMVQYIGDQLDLPIEAMDPFGSNLILSDDVSIPRSEFERDTYITALGLANSNNSITPNSIFTHADKAKQAISRRIHISAIGVFVVLFMLCIGVSFWQKSRLDKKEATILQLQQQLETFSPIVDQNLIITMVTQTKRKIKRLEEFGQKYLGMAIISEISELTPANIRLFSVTADLGEGQVNGQTGETDEDQKRLLVFEGVVFGDRFTSETSLTGYLIRLKNSPMFGQPVIQKRSFEFIKNEEVMRFTAQLELV